MTTQSASAPRAIMPSRVDLPTPEPANRPTRWPLARVVKASSTRTPHGHRFGDPAAGQRSGHGAIDQSARRHGSGPCRRSGDRARRRPGRARRVPSAGRWPTWVGRDRRRTDRPARRASRRALRHRWRPPLRRRGVPPNPSTATAVPIGRRTPRTPTSMPRMTVTVPLIGRAIGSPPGSTSISTPFVDGARGRRRRTTSRSGLRGDAHDPVEGRAAAGVAAVDRRTRTARCRGHRGSAERCSSSASRAAAMYRSKVPSASAHSLSSRNSPAPDVVSLTTVIDWPLIGRSAIASDAASASSGCTETTIAPGSNVARTSPSRTSRPAVRASGRWRRVVVTNSSATCRHAAGQGVGRLVDGGEATIDVAVDEQLVASAGVASTPARPGEAELVRGQRDRVPRRGSGHVDGRGVERRALQDAGHEMKSRRRRRHRCARARSCPLLRACGHRAPPLAGRPRRRCGAPCRASRRTR